MPNQTDTFVSRPVHQPMSIVRGQIISESPSAFLTRNARAFASCTATIAGSIANLDQIRLNLNLAALSGGKITKTITLTGTDTVSSAAQKMAKAINDDTVLQGYGCYANSLLGVVTVYWPGLLGNHVTLTQSVPVGSETITLGASGVFSGGTGPIIPFNSFRFEMPKTGQFFTFEAGVPQIVGANVVRALALAGKAFK